MPILLALLAAVPALRVDLSALKDAQRDVFLQVAADVNDYAGCRDTLLKCLDKSQKDPHALRMADLLTHLVQTGAQAQVITNIIEKYYDGFDPKSRLDMKPPKDAPVLG